MLGKQYVTTISTLDKSSIFNCCPQIFLFSFFSISNLYICLFLHLIHSFCKCGIIAVVAAYSHGYDICVFPFVCFWFGLVWFVC